MSPTHKITLSQTPRVVRDSLNIDRLLVVKLSSLGDVVHSLPLIEALREGLGKDACIAWAIRSRFASLLRGNPHLSTAYELTGTSLRATLDFGRSLRRGGFPIALDAQGLLLSGLLTRMSGAPVRIGLDRNREGNALFLTDPVVHGRGRVHIVDILLGFCDALGVPRVAPRRQRYLADGESENAVRLLRAEGLSAGTPTVGFIVGASTADKTWPAERWAETARILAADGVKVVLLGSQSEAKAAAEIQLAAGAGNIAASLVGCTPLPVLASTLALCDVVVGGDSGPTHLAVAVGAPVVGLYGVTDPARTGTQWGPAPSIVLDFAAADAPPESRRPRHNALPDALSRIPSAKVADAVLSLLEDSNRESFRRAEK